MKKQVAITVFTFAAALFGLAACATSDDGPDKRDHNQTGSGETCGGCTEADESVNDDGTVNICAPCDGEGITKPWEVPDGDGGGSGFPVPEDGLGTPQFADGNTTQLQCREAQDKGYGECDREKRVGHTDCDTAHASNMSSCMAGVYQSCGTMSQYHHCVIAGRTACVNTNLPILQSCNNDVNANYGRCRGSVFADFNTCMLHANNRVSGYLRLWQSINPF